MVDLGTIYEEQNVDGTANTETLQDPAITGTADEPKRVIALWFHEDTSTLQGDATLRAYINQKRIVDMNVAALQDADGTTTRPAHPRIPIDALLESGDKLAVGQVSGATASDFLITVEYEKTTE